MNIITEILKPESLYSSKRFISLVCLILLVIVVVAALYKITISSEYLYSIVTGLLGSSAMTLKFDNQTITPNKNT